MDLPIIYGTGSLARRYLENRRLKGADTDRLMGDDRFEDCHFSASGLDKAAELWFRRLHDIAWALDKRA